MKLILAVTIVFLASITASYSQYSPFREYQEFDWSKVEKQLTTEQKIKEASKVQNHDLLNELSPLFYNRYHKITEEDTLKFIQEFHFLDFNADNRIDLIYDGDRAGGELGSAIFFLNNGDSLKLIAKLLSSISSMELRNDSLIAFSITNFPCCCDYVVSNEYYNRSEVSDSLGDINTKPADDYWEYISNDYPFSLIQKDYFIYSEETPLKGKIRNSKFIARRKVLVSCCTKPSTDTIATNYDCSNFMEVSYYYDSTDYYNITYDYILPNEKGEILVEHYRNGKKYYYVRVKPNVFIDEKPKYPVFIYGWISEDGIEIEE